MIPNMPEELQKELMAMTAPKVELVTREDKPTSIDDYDSFMQFLMLASIASQAVKIRRYFDDRTSKGGVVNFPLNVRPVAEEVVCPHPAQSLYIVNDGPGQIFVTINALGRTPTPLLATEEMELDFQTHKLQRFFVWSAPGTIANARALTKY